MRNLQPLSLTIRLNSGWVNLIFLWFLPNDLTTTTASCPPSNVDVPHEQLAYITYIFSATNSPIKVEITNQAIVNFLLSMQREPGINESDKVLGLSSFSTDVALAELLLPLTVGAQCVIVPHEIAADSRLLSDWIVDKEITLLQATPTTLAKLTSMWLAGFCWAQGPRRG